MVKILVDLSDVEDKIVSIFKIKNSLITKTDAIKKIIRLYIHQHKKINELTKDGSK